VCTTADVAGTHQWHNLYLRRCRSFTNNIYYYYIFCVDLWSSVFCQSDVHAPKTFNSLKKNVFCMNGSNASNYNVMIVIGIYFNKTLFKAINW